MADPRDDFTWIERYLANQLTEAERSSFQARLKEEPTLQKAMREQQEAVLALRLLEKEDLRSQLKTDWQQIKSHEDIADPSAGANVKVIRMVGWGLAIAAAFALLFWVFSPDGQSHSSRELAMQYFDPDPLALTRGNEELDSLLLVAEAQYRAGQYGLAEQSYVALLTNDPDNGRYLYFLGMSLMGQQKPDAAIKSFIPLLNDPLFDEHARWNLALAYLQTASEEESISLLKTIKAQPRHYKKKEADTLLEQIIQNP